MGRPRKNPLPAVKTEQDKVLDTLVAESQRLGLYDEPTVIVPEPLKPVECNNVALSILRNPANQKWMLVSIKFDYATKTLGEMTIIEQHTDRVEITYRYQVISGTTFMSPV